MLSLNIFLPVFSIFASCIAYQVPVVDTDYSRQICSGMWANEQTFINVSFDATSQGQLAMVVYEWADAPYLGKVTSVTDELLPPQKTYVCTSSAVSKGFCTPPDLGRFILDLPSGKSINDTSFWSARVELPANQSSSSSERDPTISAGSGSLWDPQGNNSSSSAESDNGPTAWRRNYLKELLTTRDTLNPSPTGVYTYSQPLQYLVRKTGYYCVAVVPVTVQSNMALQDDLHPHYNGLILFRNKFDGRLPATDYPKVNFYFAMFIVYGFIAAYWGWLCYRHLQDLLPLQYYLSGLVGLLVIEMVANWGYYRYLNAHGRSTASTAFLIVVAILDAGRNSMSFFMLLVVSLGLSVVKESLGRTMFKCQALAVAHFIFGILYAVGIVELELESTSALVLLLFVIPLAFTLSGFLLWILYSLNATIAQLRARKQRYKLSMFEKLYHILIFTVIVIAIFFVVSSFSFSGRLAEGALGSSGRLFTAVTQSLFIDYAANSWKVQWWLLDGWLALLYLVSFSAIAYLWRPSENNRRYVYFTVVLIFSVNLFLFFGYPHWPCQRNLLRTRQMQKTTTSNTSNVVEEPEMTTKRRFVEMNMDIPLVKTV
ncbi:lung seven transmembrane receptor-domain-containing protein [Lentinula detonsa]|uniref:Lung seven transmembrane receptor-domain-containing protein n=1 Tax=Lentinula detonsa TaxID=2804962 RepID=A0AA38PSX3_9AGAR|nr:lung seven transmembrane receptor-domain-containing protein [Lentinula detonsa]